MAISQLTLLLLALSAGLPTGLGATPESETGARPGLTAPDEEKPAPKKKPELGCELLTKEAPRGGRLEVRGAHVGRTPIVRIAGKITRLIDRQGDVIAVQIPRDSDGGSVTLHADGKQAECGQLLIIGKN